MPGSRSLTFTRNHLLYLSSTFNFCSENKSQLLVPRCCFPTRPSSRIGAHHPAMALPRAGTGMSLYQDPWGSLWGRASPSPAHPDANSLKASTITHCCSKLTAKSIGKGQRRAVNPLSGDPASVSTFLDQGTPLLPPGDTTKRKSFCTAQ